MIKLHGLLIGTLCVVTVHTYAMQDGTASKKRKLAVTAAAVSTVSDLDLLPDSVGFNNRGYYCAACQNKRADLLTDALYGSNDEVQDVVQRTSSESGPARCNTFVQGCNISLSKVHHRAVKQPQNQ